MNVVECRGTEGCEQTQAAKLPSVIGKIDPSKFIGGSVCRTASKSITRTRLSSMLDAFATGKVPILHHSSPVPTYTTVSYTHLDVYKRQLREVTSLKSCRITTRPSSHFLAPAYFSPPGSVECLDSPFTPGNQTHTHRFLSAYQFGCVYSLLRILYHKGKENSSFFTRIMRAGRPFRQLHGSAVRCQGVCFCGTGQQGQTGQCNTSILAGWSLFFSTLRWSRILR